ncbi:MAG: thioredoxin family protein [Gemmatimonadota bacterium]
MKIQILGTGCPKCEKLTQVADQAARDLGLEYELVKVSDASEIARFGMMMTPALAVDGRVKVAGRVPSLDEAKRILG